MYKGNCYKKFFSVLFIFFYNFSLAQNALIYIDDQEIQVLDTAFSYQDKAQEKFLKANSVELWRLRQQLTGLPFDHCNHPDISMLLYCDSKAHMPVIQLVKSTSLNSIDSVIIILTQNFYSRINPEALHHNLIYLKYKFHNARIETILAGTGGNYNFSVSLSDVFGKIDSIMNRDYRGVYNECEEDAFFYKEGMKCLHDSSYKKAIYNFTQALEANPLDMDANYQLGIAYQKTDKSKKACECYAKGAEAGDSKAVNAYHIFCQQPTSK